MRRRAAVLWESSAAQRQAESRRLQKLSPIRPQTAREKVTHSTLQTINNPLKRPQTAKVHPSKHSACPKPQLRPSSAGIKPSSMNAENAAPAGPAAAAVGQATGASKPAPGPAQQISPRVSSSVMFAARLRRTSSQQEEKGKRGVPGMEEPGGKEAGYFVRKVVLGNGEEISGAKIIELNSSKKGRVKLQTLMARVRRGRTHPD